MTCASRIGEVGSLAGSRRRTIARAGPDGPRTVIFVVPGSEVATIERLGIVEATVVPWGAAFAGWAAALTENSVSVAYAAIPPVRMSFLGLRVRSLVALVEAGFGLYGIGGIVHVPSYVARSRIA